MPQSATPHKKRELLKGNDSLESLIGRFIDLSGDCAKLELFDNFEASKRVRKGLMDIRNIYIKEFEKKIGEIRVDIKNKRN
jgi:hypothetical protein